MYKPSRVPNYLAARVALTARLQLNCAKKDELSSPIGDNTDTSATDIPSAASPSSSPASTTEPPPSASSCEWRCDLRRLLGVVGWERLGMLLRFELRSTPAPSTAPFAPLLARITADTVWRICETP